MLVNDYLKAYEDSWQLEYDCRSLDGVFHSLELSEKWEKETHHQSQSFKFIMDFLPQKLTLTAMTEQFPSSFLCITVSFNCSDEDTYWSTKV